MEEKYCPILIGAKDIPGPDFFDESKVGKERVEARKAHYKLQCGCLKEKCEWYHHGCPAYPIQLEIIEEIEKRHKNTV